MNTTFVNQNNTNTIVSIGKDYLKGRLEDLTFFETFGQIEGDDDFIELLKDQDFTLEDLKGAIDKYESIGLWHEYGLSFDFVEATTESDGYYRYQLSYGGPSDEIRFFEDGTIIYVYLDWYCGVGFDVTGENAFEWVLEWFEGCESINWDSLDYEQKNRIEEDENEEEEEY